MGPCRQNLAQKTNWIRLDELDWASHDACQTSDFRQTSDFKLKTADFRLQTSYFIIGFQTADFRFCMSDPSLRFKMIAFIG